ncbi:MULTISPECIES: hypothetical protein [Bacillaceae]|uniref:hypothetical protein n=1 Tax=Bacillaceae TaxID=186817 RepID=UPI002FFDDEFE
MTIKWKISASLGLIAGVITYFFSYTNNTWVMSLFWSVIGFLLFCVMGVLFQTLLQHLNNSTLTNKMGPEERSEPVNIQPSSNSEDSIEETDFQSIPLTALHQSGEMQDSEKIANTIRSWTE